MVEIVGIVLGVWLVRLAARHDPMLRVALAAQAADLVTFSISWQEGAGERNPLAHLATTVWLGLVAPSPDNNLAYNLVNLAAAATLMVLKLGLFGYLVRFAPHLGRYRSIVLIAASAAGAVGALSNVVAYPNAALPLLVVAGFLGVAVRWPHRFRDAVGAALRLVASAGFALAGLATFSLGPYSGIALYCYPEVCPPGLDWFLNTLGLGMLVCAGIGLLLTAQFAARFRPQGGNRAA